MFLAMNSWVWSKKWAQQSPNLRRETGLEPVLSWAVDSVYSASMTSSAAVTQPTQGEREYAVCCAVCSLLQNVNILFNAAAHSKETYMETEQLGSMVTHI